MLHNRAKDVFHLRGLLALVLNFQSLSSELRTDIAEYALMLVLRTAACALHSA